MAQLNSRTPITAVLTHGGVRGTRTTAYNQLRRTVLACLLWEDSFYESGESVADRITTLSTQVTGEELAALAIEARVEHNLRHVSLLLAVRLIECGHRSLVRATVTNVIQRADELAEILALYWRNGKRPLAKQFKLGLADAFNKFDAYALAKYNREKDISLRDVMFLTHVRPVGRHPKTRYTRTERALERAGKRDYQYTLTPGEKLMKQLAEDTLEAPNTWEVRLSGGEDKCEVFEDLIKTNQIGYLALLRNLRNMEQAGVDRALVKAAIRARKGAQRVLPFRYTAAARHAPSFEADIDYALVQCIADLPKLKGRTVVLVDVSGSMDDELSAKSDLRRIDAAATLASMINADDLRVFTFTDTVKEAPARRGMAGVDAILKNQPNGGTELFGAVEVINQTVEYDRIIVITDEQATGGIIHGRMLGRGPKTLPKPLINAHAYMINVAMYQNGVSYKNGWQHLDGFSENVLKWVQTCEQESTV